MPIIERGQAKLGGKRRATMVSIALPGDAAAVAAVFKLKSVSRTGRSVPPRLLPLIFCRYETVRSNRGVRHVERSLQFRVARWPFSMYGVAPNLFQCETNCFLRIGSKTFVEDRASMYRTDYSLGASNSYLSSRPRSYAIVDTDTPLTSTKTL